MTSQEKAERKISKTNINTLVIPLTILLVGAMIAGAIFFGLKSSRSDSTLGTNSEISEKVVSPPTNEVGTAQKATTTLDDDAVLGDRDSATVAIVEFSDFECSFCNRFRRETLPQIKEEYLDTGKAILVYRDLPLPFHNPAAEREAIAAECAREQGDDAVYFQYHDQIFETTPGNGTGIDSAGLVTLALELNLDGNAFKSCLEEVRYQEEVRLDASAAAQAGINGTPGFVVGKIGQDGQVEGVVISGAQPYSVFKQIIDEQLN